MMEGSIPSRFAKCYTEPMLCAYCNRDFEQGRKTRFCSSKCKNNWTVTDWRRRTKIKSVEYKGGKCVRCGYNKCVAAMHFHHKVTGKVFRMGDGKGRSWESIRAELDKCELICANCHDEEHWLSDEQLRSERAQRYSPPNGSTTPFST